MIAYKYEILSAHDIEGLTDMVNEKLREGYAVVGGVAVHVEENYTLFYQSVHLRGV